MGLCYWWSERGWKVSSAPLLSCLRSFGIIDNRDFLHKLFCYIHKSFKLFISPSRFSNPLQIYQNWNFTAIFLLVYGDLWFNNFSVIININKIDKVMKQEKQIIAYTAPIFKIVHKATHFSIRKQINQLYRTAKAAIPIALSEFLPWHSSLTVQLNLSADSTVILVINKWGLISTIIARLSQAHNPGKGVFYKRERIIIPVHVGMPGQHNRRNRPRFSYQTIFSDNRWNRFL